MDAAIYQGTTFSPEDEDVAAVVKATLWAAAFVGQGAQVIAATTALGAITA